MNVQGTDYLFPLQKVISRLQGYYIDKEGHVYSTRGKGGALAHLAGSKQHSWSNRYFTLDGATWEQGYLTCTAKAHGDFAKETTASAAVLASVQARGAQVTAERAHAKTAAEALKANGSIIATVVGDKFVFASSPVIHTTPESVRDEMTRLANLNPGTRYVEFKITSSVVAGGLNWS